MRSLQREHQQYIKRQEREHAKALKDIHSQYAQRLSDLKTSLSSEREKHKVRLKQKEEEMMARLTDAHHEKTSMMQSHTDDMRVAIKEHEDILKREKDRMRRQSEDSQKAVEDKHQKDLSLLTQDRDDKINALHDKHHRMKADHESKMLRMKETLEKEQRKSGNLADQYESQRTQSSQLREKHKALQDELEKTKDQLQAMKDLHSKKVNQLSNQLASSQDKLFQQVKVMEQMSSDKAVLSKKHDDLVTVKANHEASIVKLNGEREKLKSKLDKNDMDMATYTKHIGQLHQTEKNHKVTLKDTQSSLNDTLDTLKQVQKALDNTKSDLNQEKKNHLSLRTEYEEHSNKSRVISKALETCHGRHVNLKSLHETMRADYAELKKASQKLLDEFRTMVSSNQEYEKNLRQAKVANRELTSKLTASRKQLEERMKNNQSREDHAYSALDACRQRGAQVMEKVLAQDKHIKLLEKELSRVIKDLKNNSDLSSVHKATREELETVKSHLDSLYQENRELRVFVSKFDDHRKKTADLLRDHTQLKSHMDYMKKRWQDLIDHHKSVKAELSDTQKQLESNEIQMQKASKVHKNMSEEEDTLTVQAHNSMNPVEKDQLMQKIETLQAEKEDMVNGIRLGIKKNAALYETSKRLDEENQRLKVLVSKYKKDLESLSDLSEQTIHLNNAYEKAKDLATKKDKQLSQLKTEMEALLINANRLSARSAQLNADLKGSIPAIEAEKVQRQLLEAKKELGQCLSKGALMSQTVSSLKEQIHLTEDKVRNLIEALRTSEDIQKRLVVEQQARAELEQALSQCKSERQANTDDMARQMQILEQQYAQQKKEHERMLAESQSRIASLEQQVRSLQSDTRATMLDNQDQSVKDQLDRMLSTVPRTSSAYATPVGYANNNSTAQLKSQVSDLQTQIDKLKKKAVGGSDPLSVAKRSPVEELQRLKDDHMNYLKQQERKLGESRAQTYAEMMHALEASRVSQEPNPLSTAEELKKIQAQGSVREQDRLREMLKLKSVSQKLLSEYNEAKRLRYSLAHKTQEESRQAMLEMLAGKRPFDAKQMQKSLSTFNNAGQLKFKHLLAERREDLQDAEDQKRYSKQLENYLPLMRNVSEAANSVKFPDVKSLQERIRQEQESVNRAIRNSDINAMGSQRAANALVSQVKAMTSDMKESTDAINKILSAPDKQVPLSSLEKIKGDVSDTVAKLNLERRLQDDDMVQVDYLLTKSPEDRSHLGLEINKDTGEIRNGQSRAFADGITLDSDSPDSLNYVLSERAERSLREGGHMIMVVYSYASRKGRNELRSLLFHRALEKLKDQIQVVSGGEDLDLSLVEIRPEEIVDVLSADQGQEPKLLHKDCTITTPKCSGTVENLGGAPTVDHILRVMKPKLQFIDDHKQDSHLILSLGSKTVKGKIHIVDVTMAETFQAQDVYMAGQRWAHYLLPLLKMRSTRVNLYFVLVDSDQKDIKENNAHMIQTQHELQLFFNRWREVQHTI